MAAEPTARPLAPRMEGIEPFHVMDILGRARELEAQGRSIVHMEIGEPDFTTPEPVMAAARRALDAGQTHYTPALGLPALRQAIARHYHDRFGVEVAAERVIITPGASGALLLALGAVLGRDREVLLADPGYPCNRHFARFIEGRVRSLPVGPETGYQLSAAQLRAEWGQETDLAIIASPSNPTGTQVTESELTAMQAVADDNGGRLLVDEIYQGLVYDGAPRSALSVSDELLVVNSFSKYFCMTGWRLGWLVLPEGYLRPVEKLMQNLFIAAPTLAQHAALAAFEPQTTAILEQRRDAFRERRDFLLPALRELGFDIPITPQGAFYLYADISRFSNDSHAFTRRLLDEAGVAVTPGIDFGEYRANQHVRFAYTTSMEQLQEGVERLRRFL